ncbi:hypothetical protein OLI68_003215 [Vibrio cholerae]|nr:hypothetical protein [Vibrio cholerae]
MLLLAIKHLLGSAFVLISAFKSINLLVAASASASAAAAVVVVAASGCSIG